MDKSLTIFPNIFDNKTHRRMDFTSWDQMKRCFYGMSQRKLKEKRDAELITPAVYKADTTRKNDNVTHWAGWAAIDVDDIDFNGENLKSAVLQRFQSYRFICYSTGSSTFDNPKFRLIFDLTQWVENVSIKHFWFALNKQCDDWGDPQTKDMSRMYYTPAQYEGKYNFIWDNEGTTMDPDFVMAKYPYNNKQDSKNFMDRLPDEWVKQIMEYRSGKLDNTNFVWSGYSDCPFWPKNLASEYITISSEGWYRQMYRIMIAIAGKAVERGYPITAQEIVKLCREFDNATGNWYENRPMETEANNALEYAYKNAVIQ